MGKRPQLDLGEITFGRVVSSDSSGEDHLQLIFVETTRLYLDEITLGRIVSSDSSGGHL